jgi:hypothetical protein
VKVLKAGWGDPPDDVRYDIAVNTSRMLCRAKCGELHGYIYEDGRVPDREYSPALQLGSVWHKALERLTNGESVEALVREYELSEWIERDGKSELSWFVPALRAYEAKYAPDFPGGTILATEVPFYLTVEVDAPEYLSELAGITKHTALVRGRLDRVTRWQGMACNGEIKTVKAGADLDRFMGLRSQHPQDALYYLALTHAPRTLPNGAELPEEVYGTRYDITQKYNYPASKWKDADHRRAVWREKLFYANGIPWRPDRALKVANKAISDYLGLAGIRHRNLAACDVFGVCAYFDVCHRGLPLSSGQFKDRDADYVG